MENKGKESEMEIILTLPVNSGKLNISFLRCCFYEHNLLPKYKIDKKRKEIRFVKISDANFAAVAQILQGVAEDHKSYFGTKIKITTQQ